MLPDREIFEEIRFNPEAVLATIWSELASGVKAGHPWHLAVLASCSETGAQARTVVFRACDPAARWVCCHADRRSPKCAQIGECSDVEWLFYNSAERVQIRLRGTASVHSDDEFADARWAASSLDSRRCYLAPFAQGTVLSEPLANLPPDLTGGPPTLERSEHGRQHFCAIRTVIDQVDWYYLHSAGHLRLIFRWDEGVMVAEWVAA